MDNLGFSPVAPHAASVPSDLEPRPLGTAKKVSFIAFSILLIVAGVAFSVSDPLPLAIGRRLGDLCCALGVLLALVVASSPAKRPVIKRESPPSFGQELHFPPPLLPDAQAPEARFDSLPKGMLQSVMDELGKSDGLFADSSWMDAAEARDSKSDVLRVCLAFKYFESNELEKSTIHLQQVEKAVSGSAPLFLCTTEGLIKEGKLDMARKLLPLIRDLSVGMPRNAPFMQPQEARFYQKLALQLVEAHLAADQVSAAKDCAMEIVRLSKAPREEIDNCFFRIAGAFFKKGEIKEAGFVVSHYVNDASSKEKKENTLFYLAEQLVAAATPNPSENQIQAKMLLGRIQGHEEEKKWLKKTYHLRD